MFRASIGGWLAPLYCINPIFERFLCLWLLICCSGLTREPTKASAMVQYTPSTWHQVFSLTELTTDKRDFLFRFPRSWFFFLPTIYLPDKKLSSTQVSSPRFLSKFLKRSSLPLSSASLSPSSLCAHILHLSCHPTRLASLPSPSPTLVPINHHH